MDFTTLLVALSFISLEVSLNIIVKKGLFGVRKQKSEGLPHTHQTVKYQLFCYIFHILEEIRG